MPFHKRAVGPGGRSPAGPGVPVGSLQEVSARSLLLVLRQLSELSRQAGSIFEELEAEAGALCLRGARLERRLGALLHSTRRLDHRKVPVRYGHLCKTKETWCWAALQHYTALHDVACVLRCTVKKHTTNLLK